MRNRTRRHMRDGVRARHPSNISTCRHLHDGRTSVCSKSQTQPQQREDPGDSAGTRRQRGDRLRSQIRKRQSTRIKSRQGSGQNPGACTTQNTNNEAPKPPKAPPRTSIPADPGPSDCVYDKRQLVIINMERKQRKEMVERHRSTGDPREFAAFLLPFIPPVELGEWQWDDGVQRWWREDKTTGARLWVPVEDAFL